MPVNPETHAMPAPTDRRAVPCAESVEEGWEAVCHAADLIPEAGVAVRAHGVQVAVFLTEAGLFALDNLDPCSGAAILARGIVGEIGGSPVVASPMYKQHFRLDTGQCLEDAAIAVRCWPLRQDDAGVIHVGRPLVGESGREGDHAGR